MTREIVIGIDLGTTFSLCSVLQAGAPVLIPNAIGETLTPSAVSVDDGHVLVGAEARARAATHPDRTALAFKREMGTEREYALDDKRFRPEQLSALVLGALKQDAEQALGCEVREAVVTVPAYFGEAQRRATRFAGELAGLRVDRIINEPTAAAMAYGLHARDRELRGIVLDLGGGTFDVTVLEICEGVIEVRASAGDSRLGGEDFTDALAADVATQLRERFKLDVAGDLLAEARVREAAEWAKRELSRRIEANIVLPGLAVGRRTSDVELTLTRERAQQLWQPVLERIAKPIGRVLRDSGIDPATFDEVLIVGGASRMPSFVEIVARTFGRMPSRSLPPDEAVAMGAAVQAALREGDAMIEDLVVTDVAPFSLGISASTQFGTRLAHGVFAPIIDRGTVIPVSRAEVFSTVQDFQTEIRVEVYQGEHSLCKDNTRLGEYLVRDLPPRPAGGAQIEVRFTYDLNGILEVESTIVGTSTKASLVIERSPGALSPSEVERAREQMKRLKFHAREALPNRTAIARADALYAELVGEARNTLGEALASFRGALETQDVRVIEAVRERLVALTAGLSKR